MLREGTRILPFLKLAAFDADAERAKRANLCLEQILRHEQSVRADGGGAVPGQAEQGIPRRSDPLPCSPTSPSPMMKRSRMKCSPR